MKTIPKTGELYQDFANKIYQVITVAVHAETKEQMVVYQEMSGDYGVYVRPLLQFAGENGQQCLFKKMERMLQQPTEAEAGRTSRRESLDFQTEYTAKAESRPRTQSPAESKRALRQGASETSGEGAYYSEKRRRQMQEREQRREMFRKSNRNETVTRNETATEELRANPCLMKFLEADTYEEKFHVLNEIQNDITDRLIDDIAVVLDVVIPEGALNDRFHQLRNIVLTRQKYETNRFR